jgi:microcystin degradation protein MlrC
VQPWLDIPNLGNAVIVVTAGDPHLARIECARLAAEVWNARRDYLMELVPVAAAVRQAHDITEGLVVLSDPADATTSGSPGDSTWLLRELVKYDWSRPALVPLVAPEIVTEVRRLGIGAQLDAPLGGKRDHRYSQPLPLATRVAGLFDACFVLSGHLARNLPIDMGPSAVLRHGNVHIVVTSRSGPHFAPEFFRTAGLDPFAAAVLVAKSPCGFRAAYQERARQILVVQARGCAPTDFWNYDYRQIDRPLWPWDEIDKWEPTPGITARKW